MIIDTHTRECSNSSEHVSNCISACYSTVICVILTNNMCNIKFNIGCYNTYDVKITVYPSG